MTTQLSSGARVSLVPKEMLPEAWPAIYPMLLEAMPFARGLCTPADVYTELEQGLSRLWVAEKNGDLRAICITELIQYHQAVSLRIWILSGEGFAEWKDGIAVLEGFAREQGAQMIEATGRPGWRKLAKGLGFEIERITFSKKVDGQTH